MAPKMCFSQHCFPGFKYTGAKAKVACHGARQEGDDKGRSSAYVSLACNQNLFPVFRSAVHCPRADLVSKERGHWAACREEKII